jgi:hypothetical protein
MSDQVYEVEFRGKDSTFAATAREATKALGELKTVSTHLISSFTGGVLGGGIADGVLKIVEQIREVIADARSLAIEAQKADLRPDTLRGMRMVSDKLTGDPRSLETATEATRQAVAEALKGRPEANRNFAAIGINPNSLAGLSPEEMLYRLFAATGRGPATDERRYAFRSIAGASSGDLEPYAFGGESRIGLQRMVEAGAQFSSSKLFRDAQITGSQIGVNFGGAGLQNAFNEIAQISGVAGRAKFRANLDPFSAFGLENTDAAARSKLANDEETAKQARERLSIEQQITEATKRRASLETQQNAATDPVVRERLRGRVLGINAEIKGLEDQQIAAWAKRTALPGVTFFAGGGIGGGGPASAGNLGALLASGSARSSFGGPGSDQSAVIALLTAQLTTAKQQLASLGALPASIAYEL